MNLDFGTPSWAEQTPGKVGQLCTQVWAAPGRRDYQYEALVPSRRQGGGLQAEAGALALGRVDWRSDP